MKITFTASFERDFKKQNSKEQEQVYEVIAKLPEVVGAPHSHRGVGVRKIHSTGIFEARLGLGLRLVFALGKSEIILHRLGSHDTIQKYLKSL